MTLSRDVTRRVGSSIPYDLRSRSPFSVSDCRVTSRASKLLRYRGLMQIVLCELSLALGRVTYIPLSNCVSPLPWNMKPIKGLPNNLDGCLHALLETLPVLSLPLCLADSPRQPSFQHFGIITINHQDLKPT